MHEPEGYKRSSKFAKYEDNMVDLIVDKEYIKKEKIRIKKEEEENSLLGNYIPPEILA